MDDNLIEKLKEMLDDPETMRSIGSLMSGTSDSLSDNQASQMEMMSKIKTVMDRMNQKDDPRINLLTALKPYMRTSRAAHMDRAIRMIQMTKMTSILRDIT